MSKARRLIIRIFRDVDRNNKDTVLARIIADVVHGFFPDDLTSELHSVSTTLINTSLTP
jgi:hypothetical protein